MDWSQKRKIMYATLFAGIIILLASYPAYKVLYNTPTCFDKKQNGDETGVDCGGGCAIRCAVDVKPPRVVWAKVFPIGGGAYDVGAYVENINTKSGLRNAGYAIKVLDSSNNVLFEKKGTVEFAPSSATLLFETDIILSGVPDKTEVSFDSNDINKWEKATQAPFSIVTKNQNLKNVDTHPRFDAVLVNTDPVNSVSKLSLSAVIYDENRRPVAVSKTYVDGIPKGEEHNVFFTWNSPFSSTPRSFITDIIITPRAIFAPK